jgi:hypothetical protein
VLTSDARPPHDPRHDAFNVALSDAFRVFNDGNIPRVVTLADGLTLRVVPVVTACVVDYPEPPAPVRSPDSSPCRACAYSS